MAGVGASGSGGGGDTEMGGGWSELLNTSTKLLEQAAPNGPHFPTLQVPHPPAPHLSLAAPESPPSSSSA
jgi:hypothetical protein